MTFLSDMWLPILLAPVLVFIASSVIHMVIKSHHKDYKKLANEQELLAAMRAHNLTPGDYVFPYCCDMKELDSTTMQDRFKQGPVGFMTIMPNGLWAMGKTLTQWFLYNLLISVVIALAAYHAIPAGSAYPIVFHHVVLIAMLPYAIAAIPNSIWKGLSWRTTVRFILDGVLYSLLVAGTFAWLWPAGGN